MDKGTATLAPTEATTKVGLALVAWFVAAAGLAASGIYLRAAPLVPLVAIAAITTGVVLYRRGGALREVADRVDWRVPLLAHVIRAPIGAAFLVEAAAGRIPHAFARNAGPGDLAAGLLAIALAVWPGRRAIQAWTIFGVLDLGAAFATAQYLFLIAGDPRMGVVGALPYGLLPGFVVPLMILCHLLVWKRACGSDLRRA